MKLKSSFFILLVTAFTIMSCAGDDKTTTANTSSSTAEKDEVAQQSETAINNAGKARPPKGTITLKINGEAFSAIENTVQCMFVGMGNKDMAQGMISGNITGGISISAVMMTKPQTGEVKSKGVVSTTGLMIMKDGIQYNSGQKGEFTINITKIKPDGNNHYIGGTFSGTLTSADGKEITVTDGVFESAYAD